MSAVTRSRAGLFVALTSTVALSLTACGGRSSSSSSSSSASGSSAANAAAASSLPDSIKKAGTLTIATSADYPPFESVDTDGSTIIGLDPDLGKALGEQLGIKIKFVNAGFDGLIPGLASGKYQAVMAGLQDKTEREKVVTFINYMKSGSILVVAKGNPAKINSFTDLCGKSVGVQKGTTQGTFAAAESKKCTAAGKKAINVQTYNKYNEATLSMAGKHIDAVFAETAAQALAVQGQPNQLQTTGPVYDEQHVGIAVPKDQTQLATAFEKALTTVMGNGTYKKLLAKYKLDDSAIPGPLVNKPLS